MGASVCTRVTERVRGCYVEIFRRVGKLEPHREVHEVEKGVKQDSNFDARCCENYLVGRFWLYIFLVVFVVDVQVFVIAGVHPIAEAYGVEHALQADGSVDLTFRPCSLSAGCWPLSTRTRIGTVNIGSLVGNDLAFSLSNMTY